MINVWLVGKYIYYGYHAQNTKETQHKSISP